MRCDESWRARAGRGAACAQAARDDDLRLNASFWRRDVRLYDHAIFTTYSIGFTMLLMVLASLAAAAGASAWITALMPIHMYRQLRGAYGLSRLGASSRRFLLPIFTSIVLSLFTPMSFFVGVSA